MTAVTDGDGLDQPETFAAFALRIGKSRPYVSKLKAEGRIGARCFDEHGRIIPRLALEDMAAHADPARSTRQVSEASDATYARQRARKTAADAERAEIELKARKGELLDRGLITTTLGPWIRELRDNIRAVPRDTVLDPVQAADCEARIEAAFADFSGRLAGYVETATHGGAGAAT
jgi:hypothetical protein